MLSRMLKRLKHHDSPFIGFNRVAHVIWYGQQLEIIDDNNCSLAASRREERVAPLYHLRHIQLNSVRVLYEVDPA